MPYWILIQSWSGGDIGGQEGECGLGGATSQLLTYPDSLGGGLKTLSGLLRGPLAGLFWGVHILPPFPSSGDRGFSPITYDQIDPRFGTWEDLRGIADEYDLLLDLMVNHISRQSPQFQDFLRHGRASRYADLFITLDKVWPQGDPPPEDVARIFLRKPDSLGDPSTAKREVSQQRRRLQSTDCGEGAPRS